MSDRKNYFNKKDVYTDKIEPLINQLKKACNLEKMPTFITVAVQNGPKGTEYKSDMILSSSDIKLTDNRISSILLKINGFEDKFPAHINKDIQELQEYLDRITIETSGDNKSIRPDFELKDSRIPDLYRIIEGGTTAVPPREIIETPITSEEADAISTAQNSILPESKKDLE